MFELPLVSIVITNYNREKSIAKAIESALEQDYPNLEIIISDNFSTDNSHQVISRYTNDKRVRYFRNQTNLGMLGNFKICFEERAKGDYITIVNSDDELINPQFISQCVTLINKHENIAIVKSNHIVNNQGKDIFMRYDSYKEFYTGIDFLKEINFDLDFGWAGIFLNKKHLDTLHVFNSDITAADYTTNFKLLLKGNICFNKHNSYKYYIHGQNTSLTSYSAYQTKIVTNELSFFFEHLKQLTNDSDFYLIEQKLKTFYISYIYKFNYIGNRNQMQPVIELLKKFNEEIYSNYQKKLSTKKFKLLFYYPKAGEFITKIKKALLN